MIAAPRAQTEPTSGIPEPGGHGGDLELADVPWSDPLDMIRIGSRLVSRKVGLLRLVAGGYHRAQDPLLHNLGVVRSGFSRFSDIRGEAKAGGAGEGAAAALAATLGEAVERYCMYVYDRRELVFASHEEVANNAVHPDDVRLYSRRQLASSPLFERHEYFTERSRIHWVWGASLTTRRPRLVPASLVYLDYQVDPARNEAIVGHNASSGLAAGLTFEEAVLTGLLEVIERDAFTISWLQRQVGRRIQIDDPAMTELLRTKFQAGHPSVDIRVFDNTLDSPATSCFAILRRPTDYGPALCVGSAARLDARAAVRKCLYEAGQGVGFVRYLLARDPDWQPVPDFSNLTSFDHHARLYTTRPDLIPDAFGFCDRPSGEVALSDLPDRSTGRVLGDLLGLVEALRVRGSEVVAVDITTPDIRAIGLRAVRVLATRLVPLHGNHNKPFLGPRRLVEVPEELGWRAHGWSSQDDFNPYPHPFP